MTYKLHEIPLFTNLSDENIFKLEKISYLKSYNRDEIVFYEGEEPRTLCVLVEGTLRLYKTDSKGNERYIHQFVPIGLIGELACFENIPYPATAKFLTKGKVLKIDYKKLESDFFQHPDISSEIIKSLSRKVKILSNVIHKEMILTSEAKVAKLIYENSSLFETLKNTQIASILNITPETFSRIMSKFKKHHYIKMHKDHKIEIIDMLALKSLFE